jgi:hypothetical protein
MPILGRFFRGVLLAGALPALASQKPSPAPPARSTPEGLRLLHEMQEALGGAEKLAGVRDYEETIRAEARDSRGTSLGAVRKRTRWIQSPAALRIDQVGPRGTYVLYLDGPAGSGWEILPDVQSPDLYKTVGAAVPLAGGELEFARAYLSGFELNLWLADRRGYGVTAPRPNVLRIEHHGTATDFTLDPKTSLPVEEAGVSLADPDHPAAEKTQYGEWKEFSGIRFPTHKVKFHDGVNRGETATESIRVNAALRAADLAARPASFAPDVAKP